MFWTCKAQARNQRATFTSAVALRVMQEVGIDISQHQSKHLSQFLDRKIETVITVCGNADEVCPIFPGQVNRYHWAFYDPAKAEGSEEDILKVFRQVRDEIKRVFEAYGAGRRDGVKQLI